MLRSLLLFICPPLLARDTAEEKLADRFMHAQREARAAFETLDAHCKAKGQQAAVMQGTLVWGCVDVPKPAPAAADPKPPVKTEDPKLPEPTRPADK